MPMIRSLDDAKALEGQEVGLSDWAVIDQHRIDQFAEATADHLAHLNWMKGYITGKNWSQDTGISRDLDIETVRNWLNGYCRANPGVTIAEAGEAMVTELKAGV